MSELLDNPEVQAIYIDSRGPRFSAAITTIVLATALVTHNVWILVAQGVVFAIGALRGPQHTPYAFVFKKVLKPFLAKIAPTEDVRPPRFAQAVGLAFAVVAAIGSFAGVSAVFSVAVSFALAAAFLNATFKYCLGCEMYLLLVRFTSK